MMDLEWRVAGLGNLMGPLAALGCHQSHQLLSVTQFFEIVGRDIHHTLYLEGFYMHFRSNG